MTKIQSDFYKQWKQTLIDLSTSVDVTLTSIQEYVSVDTTSNAVEIELPDTTSIEGTKTVWIYDGGGNAGTNNITIIPNSLDGTTIDRVDSYIIYQDGGTAIIELIDEVWTLVNKHISISKVETITANNEVSTISTTPTNVLTLDFDIEEAGTYKIEINCQIRHDEKDVLYEVCVLVDSVINDNLVFREYMGGDQGQGDERYYVTNFDLIELTAGTHDAEIQFATGESGKRAYMLYRRLTIERWD